MKNREELHLTEDENCKLLRFFGYGFFHEADIVFLGNEEGLGGYPIHAVKARTRVYGNNLHTWLNGNWNNGYWDETGYSGYLALGEETNQVLKEMGLPDFKKEKENYSAILDFQARIKLALEEPRINWFQQKSWYEKNSPSDYSRIEEVTKDLYGRGDLVNFALVDWRPLPRSNENNKNWPYQGIVQQDYLDAFSLKKVYFQKIKQALKGETTFGQLDRYSKLVFERVKLMKAVFTLFNFRLLLCSGDIPAKKRLIKLIFHDREVKFTKHTLPNGKYYVSAKINLPNRTLTVILTVFYNHRSNCLQLTGLESLFPIIKSAIER